ncbi:MAG: trehalose-phosphatase [Gammaproteobacteria bacterium]
MVPLRGRVLAAAVERLRAAEHLRLLLDYDGTLVPFADRPDAAEPDAELLALLDKLGCQAGAEVHLVSGRRHDDLGLWFGDLPIGLHAEHGLWSRPARSAPWRCMEPGDVAWRPRVRDMFRHVAGCTPGSVVEEKTVALAWHYRRADPGTGRARAEEFLRSLRGALADAAVDVLDGDHVVEVRPRHAHKGRIAVAVRNAAPPGATLAAFGDDVTDDDLFRALGPDDITVAVGTRPSAAQLYVESPAQVRALLRALIP